MGGVGASVYVVGASVYVVAPKIIASAPVPFWPLWALLGLELGWTGLGLGLGGLGTQGLGD